MPSTVNAAEPASAVPAVVATPAELLALAEADAVAIADSLHDGVLQMLVVARYAADAVVRGADPTLVRDAVQEALVTARQAVWTLRPRGVDGLGAALHELATQACLVGEPTIKIDMDAPATRVHAAVGMTVYRFVQAVHAGCQESGVPEVGVRARVDRATLRVEVDAPVPDLAGWHLRAAALGGRLSSRPDGAVLRLPLPEEPAVPRQLIRSASPSPKDLP